MSTRTRATDLYKVDIVARPPVMTACNGCEWLETVGVKGDIACRIKKP
jgi:hypothetical protein